MARPACLEGRTLSDLNRMGIYSVVQIKWSTVLFLSLFSDLKEAFQYFQFLSSFTLLLHASPLLAEKSLLFIVLHIPSAFQPESFPELRLLSPSLDPLMQAHIHFLSSARSSIFLSGVHISYTGPLLSQFLRRDAPGISHPPNTLHSAPLRTLESLSLPYVCI